MERRIATEGSERPDVRGIRSAQRGGGIAVLEGGDSVMRERSFSRATGGRQRRHVGAWSGNREEEAASRGGVAVATLLESARPCTLPELTRTD